MKISQTAAWPKELDRFDKGRDPQRDELVDLSMLVLTNRAVKHHCMLAASNVFSNADVIG
jgi:hypothetical protein